MRDLINLACGECKRQNYMSSRNRKNTKEKLSRNKYCRFCRKHTLHKEEKVHSGS